MSFRPRLDILPTAQRRLWPELAAIPRRYVLYGGTALALRVAHRVSVDFDLFAHDPLDHAELERLPFFDGAETVQEGENERTVLVHHGDETVKVSFFGSIQFGRVGTPEPTDDEVMGVASLRDLGGTKIKALLQRVHTKDYIDVVALLDAGISLVEIFGAASTLFGTAFNHIVAQKALTYFEDRRLATLDEKTRDRLIREAGHDLVVEPLPRTSPRLD